MNDLKIFAPITLFFLALAGLAYHKRRDIARAMKSTKRYPLDRF